MREIEGFWGFVVTCQTNPRRLAIGHCDTLADARMSLVEIREFDCWHEFDWTYFRAAACEIVPHLIVKRNLGLPS